MIIFSSFIFLNIITDQINWNVDIYLIGRYHGTFPVAVYSIAAQFNSHYLSLSTAVSSVFVPRVHKLIQENNADEKLSSLFTRVGRIQFIILFLFFSGFVFFGRPFIYWWAGPNYDNAYFITLILIGVVTIPIIQNIGIEIQRAKNLHKFRSITYFLIAIINISVSIPLVILYQGIGAAIGTAFALFIGNGILMNIYYHKKIGLNIPFFWMQIFRFIPAVLLSLSIGFVYVSLFNISIVSNFLIGICIYSLSYFAIMWFFGMNSYEKELIYSPLKKILVKISKE
jgi:O-antigen/teichoic acid export membrane protein